MTFVQNFWNRWNTNHHAQFVRGIRENIGDMFVTDDTKIKKCPSSIDKVRRDRDSNSYWDTGTGKQAGCLNKNRSSCSVRSVSNKRSSRSVTRVHHSDSNAGGHSKRHKKRYYVKCSGGDSVQTSYCDEDNQWNCTNYCEFVVILMLTLICMVGSLAGTVTWVIIKHPKIGFPWDKSAEGDKLLYMHPIMMVGGFILLSGFSILAFRLFRCCKRSSAKLAHLFFHLLGSAAIVIGAWAIFNHHKKEKNIHLYSIHSWVGALALVLFALQFVFGIFIFLVLLFCEGPTACCRASIVPIHAGLGLASYILAICACITALTERTITIIGAESCWKKNIWQANLEQQLLYGIAAALALLAVLIIYICRKEDFRYRYQPTPKCPSLRQV